jgi:hypothetical protein
MPQANAEAPTRGLFLRFLLKFDDAEAAKVEVCSVFVPESCGR